MLIKRNDEKIKILSTIDSEILTDEEGFVKEELMLRDGVHYNLNYEISENLYIKNILISMLDEDLKEKE